MEIDYYLVIMKEEDYVTLLKEYGEEACAALDKMFKKRRLLGLDVRYFFDVFHYECYEGCDFDIPFSAELVEEYEEPMNLYYDFLGKAKAAKMDFLFELG